MGGPQIDVSRSGSRRENARENTLRRVRSRSKRACDRFWASISCPTCIFLAQVLAAIQSSRKTERGSDLQVIDPSNLLFEVLAEQLSWHDTCLIGLVLAQEPPVEAKDQPFLIQLLNNPLVLPAGVLLIFYLTFLGPERKRKLEEAKRLAAIKKNDRVITNGGLHGVVVNAPPESDVVTIKLDESGNLRVKVSRWALNPQVEKNEPEKSDQDDE